MLDYITSYLKSNQTPGQAGNLFWAFVYILLIFVGLSVAVIAMNWLERKILAHMQIRLGPMRVGPHGLLQPIADAIKLLLKEDIIPSEADRFVFWIAPFMVVLTAFTVFIVVPFGPTHAVTDMNIGILFMLGVSSLSVLGIVMAGWASNSHYPLIGALRSSAQMVSYEIAMGLAVLSAILMTSLNEDGVGTLSMIGIVKAQQAQHTWFIFKFFPLGLIAFVIFAIAMVAETNRAPFDLPEAESELTAGFHTEYSGFRWSLFFPGGIFGHDRRVIDRGDAVAGGMDAPVSHLAQRRYLGPGFLADPRIDVSVFCGNRVLQHLAHAEASLFPHPDDRTRGIWRGTGADWDHPIRPRGPRSHSGHLLVRGQSCGFYVSLHLVSRDLPALPF